MYYKMNMFSITERSMICSIMTISILLCHELSFMWKYHKHLDFYLFRTQEYEKGLKIPK